MSGPGETLDEMGAWTEDGSQAWLPRESYATPGKARLGFMQLCDCHFTETRVRKVYVQPRERPEVYDENDDTQWWCDVLWFECAADAPGAVAAWHVRYHPRLRARDGAAT